MQATRYQLTKECSQILKTGHPWIFRSHLSSAVRNFVPGQWLRLVDAQNATLGYGVYEGEGPIGIRVFRRGANPPDLTWGEERLAKALAKRTALREFSNAYRVLHGENDKFPGITFDVYGDTGVLQTYSASVDSIGRFVAYRLQSMLSLSNILWKSPTRRKAERSVRVLRGQLPTVVPVHEGPLHFSVELAAGQKSGAFLDLRGLRKWVRLQPLRGKRVLNLFSYTGTLGVAANLAGASEVWNVDTSEGALEFGKRYHGHRNTRWIQADIYQWLKTLSADTTFDLILVDPPSMASKVDQVRNALSTYQRLHKATATHLRPNGQMIVTCCTSRIRRNRFLGQCDATLTPNFRRTFSLPPESDHPVGFSEGDYLKILGYQKIR